MSDLTASSCGCSNSARNNSGCGCEIIWIIILLSLCGGNGSGLFGGNGCGCGNNGISLFGGDNSCCSWIIILLLLGCFCGNSNN
ncbi:MAG: chorion class high-cysteine HCB protein 13 [bacterium]|nr:chorion class high-cysteine HCB protein 13 [bacterium]